MIVQTKHKSITKMNPLDLIDMYMLTPQEAIFVVEYVNDWDELNALDKSGLYPQKKTTLKAARQKAYTLLKKQSVQAAIQQATQYRIERTLMSKDKIVAYLSRIATSDVAQAYDEKGNIKSIHDMPYHLRCCISKIKTRTKYKKNKKTKKYEADGYITEFEVESHTRALQELIKILHPQPTINFNQSNQVNNVQANIDLSHLDNVEDIDKLLQMISPKEKDPQLVELEKIEQCNLV